MATTREEANAKRLQDMRTYKLTCRCGAPATITLRDSVVRGQLVHYCTPCGQTHIAKGARR